MDVTTYRRGGNSGQASSNEASRPEPHLVCDQLLSLLRRCALVCRSVSGSFWWVIWLQRPERNPQWKRAGHVKLPGTQVMTSSGRRTDKRSYQPRRIGGKGKIAFEAVASARRNCGNRVAPPCEL